MTLEQRNSLIIQHMPLANKIAYKFKKNLRTIDVDELRSAAFLGLVDAASRYDIDRGNFIAFAIRRIDGEIKDYLRSLGFGSKGSNSRGCFAFKGNLNDNFLVAKNNKEIKIVFEELTESLPLLGKSILWDHFVCGKRLKDIGKDLELSESRISQMVTQYRKELAA